MGKARWAFCFGLVLPAMTSGLGAVRELEEAFNKRYGQRISKAEASKDPNACLNLAGEFLAEARKTQELQPGQVVLLCQNARRLSESRAGGLATAVEAMELMSAVVPEMKLTGLKEVVTLRRKAYESASGEAKKAAGEALVRSLMALTDHLGGQGNFPLALRNASEAAGIANRVGPALAKEAQAKVKSLGAQNESAEQIALVQKWLGKAPVPGETHNLLGMLDVQKDGTIGKDQLFGANKWVLDPKQGLTAPCAPADDGTVVFPLAVCGSYRFQADFERGSTCKTSFWFPVGAQRAWVEVDWSDLQLGDFQTIQGRRLTVGKLGTGPHTLAANVTVRGENAQVDLIADGKVVIPWRGSVKDLLPTGSTPNTYVPAVRVEKGNCRFSGVHLKLESGEVLTTRCKELDKLASAFADTSGPGWIDVLSSCDPVVDAKPGGKGRWALADGRLTVTGADKSAIALPVEPNGSYLAQFKFVRDKGEDVRVALPVGAGRAAVVLCFKDAGRENSCLTRVDGKRDACVPSFSIKDGQEYTLDILVGLRGKLAGVAVNLDGQPFIRWQGSQESLAEFPDYAMPNPRAFALGVCKDSTTFRGFKVRMLTGQAKTLR